jgi:hypothetical protein
VWGFDSTGDNIGKLQEDEPLLPNPTLMAIREKRRIAAEKENEEETRKKTEEENIRKTELKRRDIEEPEKEKVPRHEYAVKFNKCPLCNNPVTWKEKGYSYTDFWTSLSSP